MEHDRLDAWMLDISVLYPFLFFMEETLFLRINPFRNIISYKLLELGLDFFGFSSWLNAEAKNSFQFKFKERVSWR